MGTMSKPGVRMQMGQQMVMTPQLLQSIRLLQLSAAELEAEVQEALEANVMLEPDEEPRFTSEPAFEPISEDFHDTGTVELAASQEAEVSGCDTAASERVEADFDWSCAESWTGGEPPSEEGESAANRIADGGSSDVRLRALQQLQLMLTDAWQAPLVAAIVDAIDDNGYLADTLGGIALKLSQEAIQATIPQLEAALKLVQSVEPTGFGARDLRECLLLQIEALPVGTRGLNAATLVVDHLDLLAARNFDAIAALTGLGIDKVRDGAALIRGLDPRPGASDELPAQAVNPEIIVSDRNGNWRVELNPETLPKVRVNSMYERSLGTAADHRGLREQLVEARWLIRGLQTRQETLLKTARFVFMRQNKFLRHGEEGMAPLTLREVADAIGMHESTICRVVANKHVATPWGIYALKAFFPTMISGTSSEAGTQTSGTAVRAMIRKIIDAEERKRPLCDGDVAALLARRGVRVARRTVAKYREAMHIAPASMRCEGMRAS